MSQNFAHEERIAAARTGEPEAQECRHRELVNHAEQSLDIEMRDPATLYRCETCGEELSLSAVQELARAII